LKKAARQAVRNNATEFLNPPIKNIGYKGIRKTSSQIKEWFKSSKDVKRDFQTTANLMERAGTGGSLFRNLYRDFLKEAAELLKSEEIKVAHSDYSEIAEKWKKVSELFYQAGKTMDIEYIDEASELLIALSEDERVAMTKLKKALA
jgi:hypothetical protein